METPHHWETKVKKNKLLLATKKAAFEQMRYDIEQLEKEIKTYSDHIESYKIKNAL